MRFLNFQFDSDQSECAYPKLIKSSWPSVFTVLGAGAGLGVVGAILLSPEDWLQSLWSSSAVGTLGILMGTSLVLALFQLSMQSRIHPLPLAVAAGSRRRVVLDRELHRGPAEDDPAERGLFVAKERVSEQVDMDAGVNERGLHTCSHVSQESLSAPLPPERFTSLSTLAVGLGHDVGNIVLPIMCHLDSLLAQNLPPQAVQELLAVRDAVKRLQRLSAGLSLFTFDPQETDVAAPQTHVKTWWEEVLPIVEASLPAHVELEHEVDADLPPVQISPHQLMQITLHLVANAVEAINGYGWISIRFRAENSAEHSTVAMEVMDNGRGMSDEVLRRALDPFFTTKKRSLTTGLGLSQINSILQAAGGSMDIQSQEGRGTRVLLRFPVLKDGCADATRTASARVFMNDQRMASYVRSMLRTAGFAVNHSESPDQNESLWITEPKPHTLAPAREFLRTRPGRHVIVVGEPKPLEDWNEPGMVVVEASHRSIQRALQRAAREIA